MAQYMRTQGTSVSRQGPIVHEEVGVVVARNSQVKTFHVDLAGVVCSNSGDCDTVV